MIQADANADDSSEKSPDRQETLPEVAFYREVASVEELLEFLSSPSEFVRKATSNDDRKPEAPCAGDGLNQTPSLPTDTSDGDQRK